MTFFPSSPRSFLGLQYSPFPPPLPPFTSSYPIDAFMTQLCNESVGRCCNRDLRYGALVHFNPAWMRDPLGGEALDVFDGMKGGVAEELTDQAKTFMIGDVSSGPLSEGFPVQILGWYSKSSPPEQYQLATIAPVYVQTPCWS